MDLAMLQKQNAAIKSDLAELNAMVEKYFSVFESNPTLSDPSQAGAVAKSHVELMQCVKKMKSTVYGPVNNVLAHFEEVCLSIISIRLKRHCIDDCIGSLRIQDVLERCWKLVFLKPFRWMGRAFPQRNWPRKLTSRSNC
jgi:hypothetical protein